MSEKPDETTITLNSDEALVLFELLARFRFDKKLEIADRAEERVLWNLHCLLEKKLAEPLQQEYGDLLAKARMRLRDQLD